MADTQDLNPDTAEDGDILRQEIVTAGDPVPVVEDP